MTLTALILAGGQSQRMGQDKALLTVAGVPLLRRTWDVARTLTPDVRVVTAQRDRYAPLLPATTGWIAEVPPPAGAPPAGPLVALAAALPLVTTDWVLLLACDLPALQASVLQQWAADLPHLPATAIAYLPRSAPGWEPLCGFYQTTCLPALEAYINQGGRSFQGWLQRPGVIPIPNIPAKMLINCNTPQDWERYQQA